MALSIVQQIREDLGNPRSRKFRMTSIGIGFGIVLLISLFRVVPGLRDFNAMMEAKFYDFRHQFRVPIEESDAIVQVDIDDKSLMEIGRWPWPREVQGQLVTALKDMGARMVVFDVEFFQEQKPEFDTERLGEKVLKRDLRARFKNLELFFDFLRTQTDELAALSDEQLKELIVGGEGGPIRGDQDEPGADDAPVVIPLLGIARSGQLKSEINKSSIGAVGTEKSILGKFAIAQKKHDDIFARGIKYSGNVVLPFHFDTAKSFVDQVYDLDEGDERMGPAAREALQLVHMFMGLRLDIPSDKLTDLVMAALKGKHRKRIEDRIGKDYPKLRGEALERQYYRANVIEGYSSSFELDLIREIVDDFVFQHEERLKKGETDKPLAALSVEDLYDHDNPLAPLKYLAEKKAVDEQDESAGFTYEVGSKRKEDLAVALDLAKSRYLLVTKYALPAEAIKGETPDFQYTPRIKPTIFKLLEGVENSSFVSIDPDDDGILRRSHLVWYYGMEPGEQKRRVETRLKVLKDNRESVRRMFARMREAGAKENLRAYAEDEKKWVDDVPPWMTRLGNQKPAPFLQIAFKAALMYLDVPMENVAVYPGEYVEVRDVLMPGETKKKTVRVPIDTEGRMLINWAGKTEEEFDLTYEHIPFARIIEYVKAQEEIDDTKRLIYQKVSGLMEEYTGLIQGLRPAGDEIRVDLPGGVGVEGDEDQKFIDLEAAGARLKDIQLARIVEKWKTAAEKSTKLRNILLTQLSEKLLERTGILRALRNLGVPKAAAPSDDANVDEDSAAKVEGFLKALVDLRNTPESHELRVPTFLEFSAGDKARLGELMASLFALADDPTESEMKKTLDGYRAVLERYYSPAYVESMLGESAFEPLISIPRRKENLTARYESFKEELAGLKKQAADPSVAPEIVENVFEPRIKDLSRKIREYEQYIDVIEFKKRAREETRRELAKIVKDKICIVGATFTGGTDLKPTPMHPRYPGVGLHSNTLNTFLTEQFLTDAPPWANALAVVILGMLVSLYVSFGSPKGSGLFFLLTAAVYLGLNWMLYAGGLVVEMSGPMLVMVFPYTFITAYRQLTEEHDKREMKSMFSTYLSPDIVDELAKDPSKAQLGGEKRVMTVCFSDVAGFTTLSETLTPEALVDLLNEYLTAMTDCIMSNQGTVDKYEGDAIMWFHGAPLDDESHAYNACKSALENQELLQELNVKWVSEGKNPLGVRIGINTGNMVAGNMGSTQKLNYTVMGDAVNQSARFEPANKEFGTLVMTSQDTMDQCSDRIHARRLARLLPKGKKKYITVYEVRAIAEKAPPEMVEHSKRFEDGLQMFFDGDFQGALSVFEECKERWDDQPSQVYYIDRCKELIENPPEKETWEGIFVQVNK